MKAAESRTLARLIPSISVGFFLAFMNIIGEGLINRLSGGTEEYTAWLAPALNTEPEGIKAFLQAWERVRKSAKKELYG